MLTRADLHSYQVTGVKHVRFNKRSALWLEMGLGKTATVLTAIRDMLDDGTIRAPVLVVAPKRVASHVWPTEPDKWHHLRDLTTTLVAGTPRRRALLLKQHTDIHVIGRDLLNWLVAHVGGRKGWPYSMVVIDEASGFKSHRSIRFRAIRKVLPSIDRLVELTGTPAPNGMMDLWSQIYMLDGGERLGRTLGHYRGRFYRPGNPHINEWIIKDGAAERIHKAVDDLCLTMEAEDYLEMPERIDVKVEVELPRDARAAYEKLETEFLLTFATGEEVYAPTSAILAGKLLQLVNGFLYSVEGEAVPMHDAKLEALAELAEGDDNLLVAYRFKSDRASIMEKFPDAVDVRDEGAVDEWNAGRIRMLLAHPASAGHGLNLQDGGRVLVWYGLPWSLELYEQTCARLYRQGQTRAVTVYHVLAKDTIDKAVMDALSSKAKGQDALLAATKESALSRLADLEYML